MPTSQNNFDAIEKLIFDEGLRIEKLSFETINDSMIIFLNNSHSIKTNISLYRSLRNATLQSLNNYRIIANGTGIHWPELDEDLSLKGFLNEYLANELRSEKQLVIA
jgi:hypothetical protein